MRPWGSGLPTWGYARKGSGTANPMAGVTRDAASGIYTPASAAEWDIVLAVAGVTSGGPSTLWLFQEASGNPADSIGAFTLTATAGASYQQAVTGWTRKAITFVDASSGGLSTTSASLPDIATVSMLTLAYIKFPGAAPVGTRNVIAQGVNATRASMDMINTPRLRGRCAANSTDGAASPTDGGVHPVVVAINRTGGSMFACDDREKLVPTFSASAAGKGLYFNAVPGAATSVAGGELYGTTFFAGAAEWTLTQAKAVLQTLGWSIAWSP